jgi:hypothetical protein
MASPSLASIPLNSSISAAKSAFGGVAAMALDADASIDDSTADSNAARASLSCFSGFFNRVITCQISLAYRTYCFPAAWNDAKKDKPVGRFFSLEHNML